MTLVAIAIAIATATQLLTPVHMNHGSQCETLWSENLGYPNADGPWVERCGDAMGVDVTPALNTCDERAELMYAIAESAGSIGDAAWEDVQAECSGRAF